MAAKRVRESYDAAQKLAELRVSLQRLRAEKQPGEGAKKSKSEILEAASEEIKALLADGYTAQQIAEWLESTGVFATRAQVIMDAAGAKVRPPARRATPRNAPREKRNEADTASKTPPVSSDATGDTTSQPTTRDTTGETTAQAKEQSAPIQTTTTNTPVRHAAPSYSNRAPIIGDDE